jgi:hypothetical protein
VQPVDVRDLAAFMCRQIEIGRQGMLNVAAPRGRDTFADLVQGCVTAVAAQARAQSELVWVDEDWLVGQGVV